LIFSRSADCVDPASQASIRHQPQGREDAAAVPNLAAPPQEGDTIGPGSISGNGMAGHASCPSGEGDAGMGGCQMEPAMSDKSIAAIAATGTDKFGSCCRPRSTRVRSCCGTSCYARRHAAVPDRMEAWVGACSCKRLVTIASGSLTKYARAYSKEKKRSGRKGATARRQWVQC
jgi:hypothetical protein